MSAAEELAALRQFYAANMVLRSATTKDKVAEAIAAMNEAEQALSLLASQTVTLRRRVAILDAGRGEG